MFERYLPVAPAGGQEFWKDSIVGSLQRLKHVNSYDVATEYANHFEDYYDQEKNRKKSMNFFTERKLPGVVKEVFESLFPNACTVPREHWHVRVCCLLLKRNYPFDVAEQYANHFEAYYDQETSRKKRRHDTRINQTLSFSKEEAIKQAFDIEYRDPMKGVELLRDYVLACQSYWTKKSIDQSSA